MCRPHRGTHEANGGDLESNTYQNTRCRQDELRPQARPTRVGDKHDTEREDREIERRDHTPYRWNEADELVLLFNNTLRVRRQTLGGVFRFHPG
jgi:hypothetical protein